MINFYKKTLIIAPHSDDEIFTLPFIYSDFNKFKELDLLLIENDPKRIREAFLSANINSLNLILMPKEYNFEGLYFHKKVSNSLFINLEDLQKNGIKFLTFLKNTYNLNTISEYALIKKHTKNSKYKCQNRVYNLIIPEIINKDSEIEKFVERLKINYFYKVSQNYVQKFNEPL